MVVMSSVEEKTFTQIWLDSVKKSEVVFSGEQTKQMMEQTKQMMSPSTSDWMKKQQERMNGFSRVGSFRIGGSQLSGWEQQRQTVCG